MLIPLFYNILAHILDFYNQQPRRKRRGTVLNVSHCVCDSAWMPVVPNRNECVNLQRPCYKLPCEFYKKKFFVKHRFCLTRPPSVAVLNTNLVVRTPKDGRGISQKQVLEQNLSSTDVHGRTSVERYTDVRLLNSLFSKNFLKIQQ